MKPQVLTLLALTALTPLCLAQVTPGTAEANGLTPRTATIDVNPIQNNTETESFGVDVAGNGNVIVGWEDDSTEDYDIFFFGAVWTLLDGTGAKIIPSTTITNTPHPGPPPPPGQPDPYTNSYTMNSSYRAFFRSDDTPTPGNTAWGPKIKANRFGNGIGMGATAYYLGFEVPELFDINLDAGGGGDFPAVQLLDNGGLPAGIVSFSDSDVEPAGDVRIGDWEYLANGNIVIVGVSRQAADRGLTGQTGGNTPTFRIVTPDGTEVKGYTAVSATPVGADMWHGVGVTANGFAVRFRQAGVATVRMFDNAGNPTTPNINLSTLTGVPHVGRRGEDTGFHGNGRDAYVSVETVSGIPRVTVLNTDGTLRWSRKVAEGTISANRADGAIAPDGRVIAVWDDPGTGGLRSPQARMFGPYGEPVGDVFWVSERDQPGTATGVGDQPRVAWRDNTVAIVWLSLNSPDTLNPVLAARLFDVTTNFVAQAGLSGLASRAATVDVNPIQNNTETESFGVDIAGNGNVIVGWEDDSTEDYDIFFFGAVWALLDSTGSKLLSTVTITNTPHPGPPPPPGQPDPYTNSYTMNSSYRAYFRANGTPTPGNTAWGPKIKANRFGDGIGMGATAYYLGFEVPALFDINLDAGGGGDFPAVQLLDNDGTASGIVSFADSDVEPGGDVRIGDWEYLSDGNIVIVGESRQAADRALTGQTGGNTPTFRIVTPAGAQVKGYTAVSATPVGADMWHGVGVTAGGFAVRFRQAGVATVRMFDNAGNPKTGNINLSTLTGVPHVGRRGEDVGFHGNGHNAYVHVETVSGIPQVTVLNTDGTLRWTRKVSEEYETLTANRADGAISPDGRVIAVWDDPGDGGVRSAQARMFSASGVPIANRFWVSERDQPAPGGTATTVSDEPRVAWRDNTVAVIWRSLNSPDTLNPVVATKLFDLPAALFITSIVDEGGSVSIRWIGGGPTYSVHRRTSLTDAPTTVASGVTEKFFSEFMDFQQAFYHVTSP